MPETDSTPIHGLGKSVLIGGGASGILSLFPGVNLLNLFFMSWIVLGAGLTVHLLYRGNRVLSRGDAILAGSLSGLVGGGVFFLFGMATVIGMTQEKIEALVETAGSLAPFLRDDPAVIGGGQFKAMMALASGLFLLFAILAGALAGWVARRLFRPAENSQP